jgi:hypothetical protein
MSIMTFFHQKFCRGATLPAFPLPTSFTVISENPSTGEVPPGHDPQCGAAPGNIPINFSSRAMLSAGGGGFPVGPRSK